MAELGMQYAMADVPLQQEYCDREQRLLHDLESLAAILRYFDEDHWAAHFATHKRALEAAIRVGAGRSRKARIAKTIRCVFREPRSVNDLVIHPLNGHDVRAGDVMCANRRLDALRGSVYALSWIYDERRFRLCDRD
ncbi:MAG: hypothetical protein ACYC5O_17150 [Anaerolineae bacterium]